MDARNELFAYLGAAMVTIVGLFTVQLVYESYLDVHEIHGAATLDKGVDDKLAAVREEEHKKLESGRVPLAQAMSAYAQRGRAASPKLALKPSPDDLSAMSGWIHRPRFEPYVPRKPAAPPPAEAAVPGVEGAAPAEGAVPAAEGAAPAAEGAEHGVAPAQPAAAPAAAADATRVRVARPVGARTGAPVRQAVTGTTAP